MGNQWRHFGKHCETKWTRYKRHEPFFYVEGENLTWNEYSKKLVVTKRWVFTAEDIVKIVAYKLDFFTVDRVQVDVYFKGGAEITLTGRWLSPYGV